MKDRIICEFEMAYESDKEKDVISRRYEYAGPEGLQRFLGFMENFNDRSFKDEQGTEVVYTQVSRIMLIREFDKEEKSEAVVQVTELLETYDIDDIEVE